MSTLVKIFLMFITSCYLFYPATSPPLPSHSCGLASHRKFGERYKDNIFVHRRKFENEDFRRRPPIINPEELWYHRPTPRTPRIFWNLTKHRCDYMRFRCMKAYTTGWICGRTIEYVYRSFGSYCDMEFQNCIKMLDFWAIAYMGYCSRVVWDMNLYVDMTYNQMANNSKLFQMYVADLGDDTQFESYITEEPTKAPNTNG